MLPLPQYQNQSIAILGLARSGLASARALMAGGANILAWDDDEKNRTAAIAEHIPVHDLTNTDWRGIAALVLSPGIPHTLPAPHPIVTAAKNAGVKIISDIYLLRHAMPNCKIIGITGTNGKSTTTALIHHIIQGAGIPAQVGGNLGQAALSLNPLPDNGIYVLELSSYQLELIPDCRIDCGVHLNLTPDHLDRHGDMEGYRQAKKNLFAHQQSGDVAIIGIDDDYSAKTFAELAARKNIRTIPLSVGQKAEGGIYVVDGILYDATGSKAERIMDLTALPNLLGAHNWQNIAAAYAATKFQNVSREIICNLITSFPGLDHRQQNIATIGGIKFINDSKATNPDSTAKALSCFKNIYWIAGGKPKGDNLDSCAPYFGNIRHAFLIGQAAENFARILTPHLQVKISTTLHQAVQDAYAQAKIDGMQSPVILLSPACASFDQFRDFEHRGQEFARTVHALIS
jgi:UDP-N-acetylmuramoylalanine--D-glutamate ligase